MYIISPITTNPRESHSFANPDPQPGCHIHQQTHTQAFISSGTIHSPLGSYHTTRQPLTANLPPTYRLSPNHET